MKHDEIKAVVICGYPGIGKSTAAANRIDICDAESSAFSNPFDSATGKQKKSNEFPRSGWRNKMRLKKIPKMCITCQYYRPYHCELDDTYIGYLYCDIPTKCKAYRLSADYKRGGKWYEERLQDADRE